MTRREAIKAVAVGGTAGALAALDKADALAFVHRQFPPPVQVVPFPNGGWLNAVYPSAAIETKLNGDVEITFPDHMEPGYKTPFKIITGAELEELRG